MFVLVDCCWSFVVYCVLFVYSSVFGSLFVVSCGLFAVCGCSLCMVRRSSFVVRCVLLVVCCMLFVVYYLLCVDFRVSFVVRCLPVDVRGVLFLVWCSLCVVRCSLLFLRVCCLWFVVSWLL